VYNIIKVVKVNSRLILFIIILAGTFLRFFMLSVNPPSLTWDEAAWGYNAYSILLDQTDEFGKKLPFVYLESFGDYKPPLYAYITAPFVKLLGLTEIAVRFPSALFGVLTILLTYFLTKKIFYKADEKRREGIALLSAGILAISPWHILLSRAAFEANVATFFIVLGIYLFLVSLERKWFLPFAAISLVASMYTFNTARIFVPLLGVILFLKFHKTLLLKMRAQTLVALIIAGAIFLPLLLFMQTPQAKLRFSEVNIFTDAGVVVESNRQIENDNNAFWSKILHNRRVGYSLSYVRHYFDNLSPQFLFISGDGNPKFSIQSVGQMYIWEIPFFIMGILFLFKKKEGYYWIIPIWIILGLIPAGTARETPHALRIETIIPTFQILTAYGLVNIFMVLRKSKSLSRGFYLMGFFVAIFAIFNFLYFLHNYFKHYPKEFSGEWQYGYKEAIAYANEREGEYDNIVMTEELGRPYVYVLFYSKYDPAKFRKEVVVEREALGFVHVRSFGKYIFRENIASESVSEGNNLYIDIPENIPGNVKKMKEFKLLNGNVALVAYEK